MKSWGSEELGDLYFFQKEGSMTVSTVLEESVKPSALVKYSIEDAEITNLATQFMPLKINGINDAGGFAAVHSARMVIKNHRVEVEKRRKELKADALEWGRKVDAEAKRITGLLEPIESHLQKEEDAIEAEKERIRNAERLRQEAEARAKAEAEAAKLKAEQEAEAARLRVEREKLAEQQRIIDEERRKIEEEKHKLAEIEAEKTRKIQAEQARLAAIEAVKLREIANEQIRKETEERVKKETEARIAREKAIAEMNEAREKARQQRALALRPDKEKLLAVADEVAAITVPQLSKDATAIAYRVQQIINQAANDIRLVVKKFELETVS
jgi:hypothetical protein